MKTTQESSLLHGEHLPKAQYVKSEDSGHRSSFSRIGPQCQSLSFFFMPISLQKGTTTSSGTYENKKV